MKLIFKHNRHFIPGLISFIILLLCVGSIFLFYIFRNMAWQEIDKEGKRIDSTISRTFFREFQRLELLQANIIDLNVKNETELKHRLIGLQNIYGKQGQIPFIIKTVSYFNIESWEFMNSWENVSWSQNANPLTQKENIKEWLNEIVEEQIKSFSINNENGFDQQYLVYPLKNSKLIVLIELDIQGFLKRYLIPSIEESMKDYEQQWLLTKKDQKKLENKKPFSKSNFRFHPLKALSGLPYDKNIDLVINTPYMDKRGSFKNVNKSLDRPFKNDIRESSDRPFKSRWEENQTIKNNSVLIIGHENNPFYKEVEKKIAVNWLESMAILIGLALAFFLLVLQLINLKRLRSREKEFVASMTHELRTPLTVIQSAADNLTQGIIPPERVKQYGQLVKDQILRLGTMIEEIIQFSSMEGNFKTNMKMVNIDLPLIIDNLKKELEALCLTKKIEMHWDIEGLPQKGKTYPKVLLGAMNNIILNAIMHAYIIESINEKEIRIIVKTEIPTGLLVLIEDDGMGISKTDQKQIFEPFYRSSFSRENHITGSGLGLFIAKRQCQLHGGNLKIESPYKKIDGTQSKGCRFILNIAFETLTEGMN